LYIYERLKTMTFIQLQYVIAASRLGSISKVAEEAHISQSAVSREIKLLEYELHTKLFVRYNKGITPTTDGMNFISYACALLQHRDQILKSFVLSESLTEPPHIYISAQRYSIVSDAFVKLLNSTSYENGGSFKLEEKEFDKVVADVSEGRSDIGVIFITESMLQLIRNQLREKHLQFFELIRVPQRAILSVDHPLAKAKSITIGELLLYPYVNFSLDTNDPEVSVNLLGIKKPMRNITVSDRAIACEVIAGTNGYTIGSGSLIHDQWRDRMAAIPISDLDNCMIPGWIKTEDQEMTSEMKTFVAYLQEASSAFFSKLLNESS